MITLTDWMAAMADGNDQISQKICTDPDVVKKTGGPGNLVFKNSDRNRTWTVPRFISNTKCTTASDCASVPGAPQCKPVGSSGNFCQYTPEFGTDVFSGTCNFASQELCEQLSNLPYTCDAKGCKIKPEQIADKTDPKTTAPNPYVEWHTDLTCRDDSGCIFPSTCNSQKHCTCTGDQDCAGNLVCVGGQCSAGSGETTGRCILGNFLLRQYCENPKSRCAANPDGSMPDGCDSSGDKVGVSDVPPFIYDKNLSQCFETKEYCDRFDQGFDAGAKTCTKSGGQKVGEFLLGKTIFNFFSKGAHCSTEPVSRAAAGDFLGSFSKLPKQISVNVDPGIVAHKTLLRENFGAPGVSLFLVYRRDVQEPLVGFDVAQVRRAFPEIVKPIGGQDHIVISLAQVVRNPALKKIYLTLGTSTEITNNIFSVKK